MDKITSHALPDLSSRLIWLWKRPFVEIGAQLRIERQQSSKKIIKEESRKEWNRRMLALRRADEIYEIFGQIENGTFYGRWHFCFDSYYDPRFTQFGTLRVFNDDTLSPGASWSLHRHSGIDVVTYCADGEFRHADENGVGPVLHKGWVQRTTIGIGMVHSAINNRVDESMRFIQTWFIPSKLDLETDMQQKRVEREARSNRFLAPVSNRDARAVLIHAEAEVYSSYLQ